MFTDFLYILRSYGMKTSLNEWNMLLEALDRNLNECSLTEFYHMARCILVKRVEDYDRFDQAFLAYFKNLKNAEVLPPKLLKWLEKQVKQAPFDKDAVDAEWKNRTLEEIRQMLRDRLKNQRGEHHGGSHWIGTGGTTPFGNGGYAPFGIRIGGEGHRKSAIETAGERRFRDFRDDSTVETRDFQVALRKLRLLSMRDDAPRTEFNVDRTIEETSKNAGLLKIVMERPRKNQTKLLLLMDSGGSMWVYTDLCSRLFTAVNRSTHFKDLKIFYFHNCIYDRIYRDPSCRNRDSVPISFLMQSVRPEYKTILVGDASMAPYELFHQTDAFSWYSWYDEAAYRRNADPADKKTGFRRLEELRERFPASIWLNPMRPAEWDYSEGYRTISAIRGIFPMFPLTQRGLEEGIQELKRA